MEAVNNPGKQSIMHGNPHGRALTQPVLYVCTLSTRDIVCALCARMHVHRMHACLCTALMCVYTALVFAAHMCENENQSEAANRQDTRCSCSSKWLQAVEIWAGGPRPSKNKDDSCTIARNNVLLPSDELQWVFGMLLKTFVIDIRGREPPRLIQEIV